MLGYQASILIMWNGSTSAPWYFILIKLRTNVRGNVGEGGGSAGVIKG